MVEFLLGADHVGSLEIGGALTHTLRHLPENGVGIGGLEAVELAAKAILDGHASELPIQIELNHVGSLVDAFADWSNVAGGGPAGTNRAIHCGGFVALPEVVLVAEDHARPIRQG